VLKATCVDDANQRQYHNNQEEWMSRIDWRLDAGAKVQQGRCTYIRKCNINLTNGEAGLYAAALGQFFARKVTSKRINLLIAVVLHALDD
jgi:hypothetical protein